MIKVSVVQEEAIHAQVGKDRQHRLLGSEVPGDQDGADTARKMKHDGSGNMMGVIQRDVQLGPVTLGQKMGSLQCQRLDKMRGDAAEMTQQFDVERGSVDDASGPRARQSHRVIGV